MCAATTVLIDCIESLHMLFMVIKKHAFGYSEIDICHISALETQNYRSVYIYIYVVRCIH